MSLTLSMAMLEFAPAPCVILKRKCRAPPGSTSVGLAFHFADADDIFWPLTCQPSVSPCFSLPTRSTLHLPSRCASSCSMPIALP